MRSYPPISRTGAALTALTLLIALPLAAAQERPQPRGERTPRPTPPAAPSAPRETAADAAQPEDEARRASRDESRRGRGGRPEGPPVRFEATVFSVSLPQDAILQLEADKLAEGAGTNAALDKALRNLGKVSILYREDQIIKLGMPVRIGTTADTPYVSGTSTTTGGTVTRMIARQDVGTRFDLNTMFSDADDPRALTVILGIDVSSVTSSDIAVADEVKSPVFRKVTQTYAGPLPNRPIVLVSVDGAATNADGHANAIVTRIVFTPFGG